MRVLLDTHVFIWWTENPDHLSTQALRTVQDKSNTPLLSLASIWEMQIKAQLGKLKLSLPLSALISQQQSNGITILPITIDHIYALGSLPDFHKDPFDRLLIAQTILEGIAILSDDVAFKNYPVSIIW